MAVNSLSLNFCPEYMAFVENLQDEHRLLIREYLDFNKRERTNATMAAYAQYLVEQNAFVATNP